MPATTDTRTHTPATIVLGEGGWTVYPLPRPDEGGGTTVMISGYGRDWRDYLPHADPDCPIVDIRRALHDGADAVTFSVAGPMVGPTVPAGHLSTFANGLQPFDPRPEVGRPAHCAPLGNAHAFDYAAPDVHARIARAMDVPVYTAAECLADPTLGDRP